MNGCDVLAPPMYDRDCGAPAAGFLWARFASWPPQRFFFCDGHESALVEDLSQCGFVVQERREAVS